MNKLTRALPLLGLLALAGCSSTGPVSQPVATVAAPVVTAPVLTGPSPAQQVANAQVSTNVDAYVDPAVLPLMSPKEKADASSAQFYALQFGRPARRAPGAGRVRAVRSPSAPMCASTISIAAILPTP